MLWYQSAKSRRRFRKKPPRPPPHSYNGCHALVRKHIGSLDAIDRVVRITGYLTPIQRFTNNISSSMAPRSSWRDVFGEAGRHARTALGMAQLPLGSSVEVEMILENGRT